VTLRKALEKWRTSTAGLFWFMESDTWTSLKHPRQRLFLDQIKDPSWTTTIYSKELKTRSICSTESSKQRHESSTTKNWRQDTSSWRRRNSEA